MSTNGLRTGNRETSGAERGPRAVTLALAFSGLFAFGCDASKSASPPANTNPARGSGGSSGSGMMMGMTMGSGGKSGGIFEPAPGGSGGSGGGSQPEPPPVNEMGMTAAKFCNPVYLQGMMPIEFTLEVGTKATRFTANSGECTPILNQACSSIPGGDVPIRVSAMNRTLIEGVLRGLPQNQPIVLFTLVNQGELDLGGFPIPQGQTCDKFNPFERPDGGTSPQGDAGTGTSNDAAAKPDGGSGGSGSGGSGGGTRA